MPIRSLASLAEIRPLAVGQRIPRIIAPLLF